MKLSISTMKIWRDLEVNLRGLFELKAPASAEPG
jgi:hypothetical protein